jgi:hypothetical protein
LRNTVQTQILVTFIRKRAGKSCGFVLQHRSPTVQRMMFYVQY